MGNCKLQLTCFVTVFVFVCCFVSSVNMFCYCWLGLVAAVAWWWRAASQLTTLLIDSTEASSHCSDWQSLPKSKQKKAANMTVNEYWLNDGANLIERRTIV